MCHLSLHGVLQLLKEVYQKYFIGCFKDNDNFFQLDLEPNFWLVELFSSFCLSLATDYILAGVCFSNFYLY